jgi:N-methylhydantoinase A
MRQSRIGVDIGGTFTDVVLVDAAAGVLTRKVLSTSDDYGRAIVMAIRELVTDATAVTEIVHGTTICTNAILESKGARTGLLTTRGFRDTLELGRMRYPRLYDLTWTKPTPLVARRHRLEIDERIDARGEVVEPLDERSARTAIAALREDGIESLAVCLINSYANGVHEEQLRALLEEIAPDLPISLSSDVLPEIGEYERTSTTVINAYLQPVVGQYLGGLATSLASIGITAPIWVMQSNGGVMSAAAASERPIHIVESGPAAGVIASLDLAGRLGLTNVITLDMGGTTAKTSILENGRLHRAAEYEVGAGLNVGNRLNSGAGYRLRVPAIDIAEVGAGGGSLVWTDAVGVLHVGPESAGAAPGPVCYGLGGEQTTLTDANLLLGYLNQDALLGGTLPLDRARAEQVFVDQVARPLKLDLLEAAYGVYQIGVANMVRAVRAISSERGRDPRQFTFIAYGGNGPLHAIPAAEELGVRRVVIPPLPGLFSAFGLLAADPEYHVAKSVLQRTDQLTVSSLKEILCELETRARAALARQGYAPHDLEIDRFADLRYVAQSFELRLALPSGDLSVEDVRGLAERFEAEHERTYGHRAEGDPVELVHMRVEARHRSATGALAAALALGQGRSGTASGGRRQAYFGPRLGLVEMTILGRQDIGAEPADGPIAIEEYDATTVVPPWCRVARDDLDNLVIEVGDR